MSIATTDFGTGEMEFIQAYVSEDFLDMEEARLLAIERDEQAAFALLYSIDEQWLN